MWLKCCRVLSSIPSITKKGEEEEKEEGRKGKEGREKRKEGGREKAGENKEKKLRLN